MSKNINIGKCRICGRINNLSKEHVPPKVTNNNENVKVVSGMQIVQITQKEVPWDMSGMKYEIHQGGWKYPTICKKCNNFIGKYYVPAYSDFMKKVDECIINEKSDYNKSGKKIIYLKNIQPLKIIKQIACMFLTINGAEYFDNYQEFRDFVLSTSKSKLSEKFVLYAYIFKSGIVKKNGFQSYINLGYNPPEQVMISEIIAPPLGFVLQIKEGMLSMQLPTITNFSEYNFDEKIDLEIELPALESNTIYNGNYATKEELLKKQIK
jgi:hypothetical protein